GRAGQAGEGRGRGRGAARHREGARPVEREAEPRDAGRSAREVSEVDALSIRRQLAAKRAGERARTSKRSVFPSTIRSAAIGPSAPLVSMPQPPWPASQKKPRTRGSSPTTGTRSGAKVRSPDHLRRSVCGTSDGA